MTLGSLASLSKLNSPLSDKTLKWLESNADFSRVSSVFDRIAEERRDIEQAQDAGQVLDKLLARGSRVEMFPELRQGWAQALILENQLVLVATLLESGTEHRRQAE